MSAATRGTDGYAWSFLLRCGSRRHRVRASSGAQGLWFVEAHGLVTLVEAQADHLALVIAEGDGGRARLPGVHREQKRRDPQREPGRRAIGEERRGLALAVVARDP